MAANPIEEKALDFDDIYIACNGGISMEDGGTATTKNLGNIGQLLKVPDMDDVGQAERRCHAQLEAKHNPFLPREMLVNIVKMRGLK
jgi:hypothetical protein